MKLYKYGPISFLFSSCFFRFINGLFLWFTTDAKLSSSRGSSNSETGGSRNVSVSFFNFLSSRYLDCHGLVLFPDFTLSFPCVQSSPLLSSLVFAGYTKNVVSHLSHAVRPILSEEDGKPARHKSSTKSKEVPPRRISGSTAAAISPTKPHRRHSHHHHHHHHHHQSRRPSTGALTSPLKHSSSGAFFPTASSRHHARVPVSPIKSQHPPLHRALPSLSPTGAVPPPLQTHLGMAGAPPSSSAGSVCSAKRENCLFFLSSCWINLSHAN